MSGTPAVLLLMSSAARVKHAIKVVIAHSLYWAGLLQLFQRVVLRRKAVVLMYHRVLTDEQRRRTGSHPGIVVSRETFACHMRLLKRRFAVMSFDEFAHRLECRVPFPDSACLITFDDGWCDNFENGLSILREYSLPALIFLPVNFIGRRRLFWREALTHLLALAVAEARRNPERRPRLTDLLRPAHLDDVLGIDSGEPLSVVASAINARASLGPSAMERLVSQLSVELGVGMEQLDTPDGFMNWDQVRAMAREGIAFGSHGADHLLLTDVTPEQAQQEIELSRNVLGATFRDAIPVFGYPNGNWNQDIARRIETAGYRFAFTTKPGFVTCDDDRFTLRRFNIHEMATASTPMFLARIVGLF